MAKKSTKPPSPKEVAEKVKEILDPLDFFPDPPAGSDAKYNVEDVMKDTTTHICPKCERHFEGKKAGTVTCPYCGYTVYTGTQ